MVFVTGATGLLGSHLLYFLAVSGHSVSALRRKQSRLEDSRAVFLQYPDGEKYWNTINWVEGDVVQKEGLAEYVRRLTMFITVLLWCLFRGRIGCI